MTIMRNPSRDSFTVIDNSSLRDGSLSAKAKGIHAVLLSLPDNWVFNQHGLRQFMTDKEAAIRSGLDELENAGYLKRSRMRRDDGTYGETEWTVYERPQCEKPILENPVLDSPILENQALLNTDLLSTDSKYTPECENQKQAKHKHGEFSNVLLTDKELESLKERFPNDWKRRVDNLSYYLNSTGKKYKSHYGTILNWDRMDKSRRPSRAGKEAEIDALQAKYSQYSR